MNLEQAEQLARKLMAKHRLDRDGWRFAWSNGKRQLGVTMIRETKNPRTGRKTHDKTIRLSRYLVELNGDDEVRDTILHEIAHALAGLNNGHNEKWKRICRRIGANPQRIAGEHVATPPAPYHIVCGVCEQSLGPRHRRMDPKRLAEAYCRACGRRSKGKLRFERNDTGDAAPKPQAKTDAETEAPADEPAASLTEARTAAKTKAGPPRPAPAADAPLFDAPR